MPNPAGADDDVRRRIEAGLGDDVPKIYFNGFVNSLSSGDVQIILEKNGQPTAFLNASYTVIKTLTVSLGTLIANLEDASDQPIMTTRDVSENLTKAAAVKAVDAKATKKQAKKRPGGTGAKKRTTKKAATKRKVVTRRGKKSNGKRRQ